MLQSEASADGKAVHEMWVDPERQYFPLRFITRIDERPSVQVDCRTVPHPTVGHALSGWRMTALKSNGELSVSESVDVVAFEANAVIPEHEFQIEFPAGASVWLDDSAKSITVATTGPLPAVGEPDVSGRQTLSVLLIVGISTLIVSVLFVMLRGRQQGGPG